MDLTIGFKSFETNALAAVLSVFTARNIPPKRVSRVHNSSAADLPLASRLYRFSKYV